MPVHTYIYIHLQNSSKVFSFIAIVILAMFSIERGVAVETFALWVKNMMIDLIGEQVCF